MISRAPPPFRPLRGYGVPSIRELPSYMRYRVAPETDPTLCAPGPEPAVVVRAVAVETAAQMVAYQRIPKRLPSLYQKRTGRAGHMTDPVEQRVQDYGYAGTSVAVMELIEMCLRTRLLDSDDLSDIGLEVAHEWIYGEEQ